MAGNIKGITIEFNGDTTKLDKALRQINNEILSIDKELKQVDKALKFNPTSVELWRQKQDLLKQKIGETETKLKTLKQAQAQMDASEVDNASAEYRQLERDIIVTENQVKNFKGQLAQVGNVSIRAASEQVKAVGNQLTAAGQAMQGLSMAAGAVVASLGAISYKAGQNADDLNTLSKIYGIGTQDLQKYSVAADLVDVDVETIAKSHVKLGKAMASAQSGTGAAADAFAKLGVDVTDADGNLRDSDTVWQETIAALGEMEAGTERDALAMQLMGKSAQELNPLIEDGGETYKNLSDTMSKYGLDFVDQETLDKANEFNDELDTMKAIGAVAIAQVGSQLAATLAPMLEKIVGWIGKLAEWLGNLSPEVLTAIGVVAGVIAVLAPVLLFLGKMAFAISSIMSLVSTVGPLLGALAGPVGIVIAVIAALVAVGVLLYKNWDTIKAKAQEIWTKVTEAFNNLKTSVTNIWNGIKTSITNTWRTIKNFVFMIIQTIVRNVTSRFQSLKSTVSSVWTNIKKAITDPITSAKEKVKGVIDKIKDFFPLKLGKLLNFSLPSISIGTKEKTVGGKTIKVPDFSINWSSHALGGIITRRMLMQSGNTIHEFGEAGPEAIVPLDRFWNKLDNMSTGETTINIVINGAGDPKAVADEVKRMLIRETNQRRLAWQ